MKYAIQTFGCKVNQYESSAIGKAMTDRGFTLTEDYLTADIVIINSCSVTDNSDKKAEHLINKIKRSNPFSIVCLCGCFPQSFPERAKSLPADIIIGTEHKTALADTIMSFCENRARVENIPPRPVGKPYESYSYSDMEKTRAFIKIEDGCDRFCSYCIIPTARGSVRSRDLSDIVKETKFQVQMGHKEIVLVGINLSCYGIDMGLRLSDAVRAVADVDGVVRVRLSSLEPDMMDDREMKALSEIPKLCPHFHLALQSGCDDTLKRMNRRYTTEEYKGVVAGLRQLFPGCSITTDIMVGFAGETEEEFKATMDFVREIGFASMHVFTYSVRQGTAAAKRNDFVDKNTAARRYKEMTALAGKMKEEYFNSLIGKEFEVLIQKRESEDYANGLTPQYAPVRIYQSNAKKHDLIRVRIKNTNGAQFCVGEEIKYL